MPKNVKSLQKQCFYNFEINLATNSQCALIQNVITCNMNQELIDWKKCDFYLNYSHDQLQSKHHMFYSSFNKLSTDSDNEVSI